MPLLVQYNIEDELFTVEGQREADEKIAAVYSSQGNPGSYISKFYPGTHKFDEIMQEDVFHWLNVNLGQ